MSMMLAAPIMQSSAQSPPTDYITYYSMDNVSGTTLIDETGNYNGSIFGATQVAGFDGQALSFDGINDYVTIPARPSSTERSIFFRVKSTDTGTKILFEDSVNYNNNIGAMAILISAGNFYCGIKTGAGDTEYILKYVNESLVMTGSYVRVCITYNNSLGSTENLKLYLDGVRATESIPLSFVSAVSTYSDTSYVGSRSGGSLFLNMDLDDYTEFDRELSPSEVAQLN